MAKFCKYCGRPLAEGEVCRCMMQQQNPQPQQQQNSQSQIQWQQVQKSSQPQQAQAQQTSQAPQQVQPQQVSQPQPQQNSQSRAQWQPQQPQSWEFQQQSQNQQSNWEKNVPPSYSSRNSGEFWESMKERMGIKESGYDPTSPYEDRMNIIPDIVKPNDGEVPIRQYKIATLQNKIAGFTYAKAVGRIQVTNKRILFRAPGKSILGMRTSLQHEFLIDEIGGIEARRENIFNKGDMLLGLFIAFLGFFIMSRIVMSSVRYSSSGAEWACIFLSLFFGITGILPFFMMQKRWLLKMFLAGVSCGALVIPIFMGSAFFAVLFIVPFIAVFVSGFFCSIRPNLVLSIKPKGAAGAAIDIRRTSTGIGKIFQRAGGTESDDHTGFREIFPEEDAEKAIREIGAMINDIQKMGDYAVSKWKQ